MSFALIRCLLILALAGSSLCAHSAPGETVRPGAWPSASGAVYPGIEIQYHRAKSLDAMFEYDFIVAPGADPAVIRLAFPNAVSLLIDGAGDLVVRLPAGEVRHRRPYSFQILDGLEVEIPSAFQISNGAVTFDLGEYDRQSELVIDPEVVYSTLVTCCLQAIGPDGSGYHVTSANESTVFQKVTAAGQSQYLLPLNGMQRIWGIAVDGAGALYASGQVDSAVPPPLANAVRTAPASSFLVKVRPDGTGFAFVTYYEGAYGRMAVANDGSIYVASLFGPPAVTKIAPSGAVTWTHSPAIAAGDFGFGDVAVEGAAVFAAGSSSAVFTGGISSSVAALVKLGAGPDPSAGAFQKTWTATGDVSRVLGVTAAVEPDGSGGAYIARTEFRADSHGTSCATSAVLTRVDTNGSEVLSVPVLDHAGCSDSVGVKSMARAANGDLWAGGLEGTPGSILHRAFVRRYPPSLAAPSFMASSSSPREPLIEGRSIIALDVDALGDVYTVSRGALASGFVARKTAMTTASPVGVPQTVSAAQPASGQSALVVSWQPVAGAIGYQVSVFAAPFGEYSVVRDVLGGASASVLVPIIQNTAQTLNYTVLVRACINGFGDTSCGESARAGAAVTLQPMILAPTAGATLTRSTVVFSWENVPVFTSNKLTILRNGQQVVADTYPAPLTQAIYSLPSGNYTMRLAGYGNGASFEVTRNFTILLPAVPSSTPAIESAVVNGGNSVTVTFPAVSGADLYLVQVIQPNTGPGGGALTVAARIVSASRVALQVPAGAANVVVSACNGDGCAPHSAPVAINPAGPNPPVPVMASPPAGTFVTGPVVFFSWSRIPGDNGANTAYRLYVQDFERQGPAGNIYTTQNFWALRLQPGRRYDAIVLVNTNGTWSQSGVTNFVLSGPVVQTPTPVLPGYQETNVPRRPDGSIALAWAPVPGASSYEWVLYPAGGAPITSGVEYTDARGVFGLGAGRYTGKVRACLAVLPAACSSGNDTNWGAWSDVGGTGPWSFTLP